MRHFFENEFPADKIMAPYLEIYYAHELPISTSVYHKPFSLFRGHFGWDLPEALPEQNLRIVTILREPLERLLSLFSYLKQRRRLAADLTLEAWIEGQIKITDLMVSYFVPGARNRPGSGYEITRVATVKTLPIALENLESCLAIGLTEDMDDVLNLLAWHTGILPCRNLPRNNPTELKVTKEELPERLISKMEKLLECDYILYAKARELFHKQLDQLYSDVYQATGRKMDSAELRSYLIDAYLQRYRHFMQDQQSIQALSWAIEDRFHGENLHEREQHFGEGLRWTGPHPTTFFYFYLGKPSAWLFKLKLHRATPGHHLQTMTCQVNATYLELEQSILEDGHYLVTAMISKSISALSKNQIATFEITTELVRGESEFRMLGMAIMGFVLHPL